MREWVVGFLIDPDRAEVVLIRKNRPVWMRGRANGVGGKVELGESPRGAMQREFFEETGLDVSTDDWEEFVTLTAVTTEDRSGAVTTEPGVIHFYRAFRSRPHVESCTDEHVFVCPIAMLPVPGVVNPLPNLLWLVPLAAHQVDTYSLPLEVTETSTVLRTPSGDFRFDLPDGVELTGLRSAARRIASAPIVVRQDPTRVLVDPGLPWFVPVGLLALFAVLLVVLALHPC